MRQLLPTRSYVAIWWIREFLKDSFCVFQVAALKRNLQLEEMRQFRQMSRPSFQLKPREDSSTTTIENENVASFLDNSYDNEEWYTSHVSFAT